MPDRELYGAYAAAVAGRYRDRIRYFEIWNDVFMGYRKDESGAYNEMERKCIDTGMGIERTIAILQGKKSVYETEVFTPIIAKVEELTGRKYGQNEDDAVKNGQYDSQCGGAVSFLLTSRSEMDRDGGTDSDTDTHTRGHDGVLQRISQ